MIYDYKSKSTVQDVILDSIEKLTSDIEDEFASLRRYQYLIIYSPAFLAKEIIGEILDDEDDTWVNEDAHFELLHDDENEVLITLAYDGMLFIEEARGDNGELKISDFSALTYVYDGFSKRDVDCLTSEGESVLVFGFDDGVLDDEYGYEINGVHTTKEVFNKYVNTYINPKKDEEKKELSSSDTESSVTYHVNGEQVDKKTYEKAIADIEDAYLDNVRDMLLGYCEVMDRVNEFYKLLW